MTSSSEIPNEKVLFNRENRRSEEGKEDHVNEVIRVREKKGELAMI